MCLAQGHNAVPSVRLKRATLRSRVKHSTTEPQHSPIYLSALQTRFYHGSKHYEP